jgi:hypothetical protein
MVELCLLVALFCDASSCCSLLAELHSLLSSSIHEQGKVKP